MAEGSQDGAPSGSGGAGDPEANAPSTSSGRSPEERRHFQTLIVGFVGVLVGSLSTLVIAFWSTTAQAAEAKDEFLRTQRMSAYVQLLTDVNADEEAQEALLRAAEAGDDAKLVDARQAVDKATSAVRSDYAAVFVVGSPQTQGLAAQINNEQLTFNNEAVATLLAEPFPLTDKAKNDAEQAYKKFRGFLDEETETRVGLIPQFRDAAHNDLGN